MKNDEFTERVLQLIGLPYSECDCIGVVRRAAGIRCQGTNWLWRSFESVGKYRYLLDRQSSAPAKNDAINGQLVFRIRWNEYPKGYTDKPNCHHVGVIVNKDVIQSTEKSGVCRKPYNPDEWNGAGWLKFIDYPTTREENEPEASTEEPELSDHDMIRALYNHFIID